MGKEVSSFCLDILNNGSSLDLINVMNIVLIPKVSKPLNMSKFHPISMCNVIYKLVAKVNTNKFRKILDECIDKSKSAFIPRRLISDNVLLAYELFHTFGQKRGARKALMV